MMAAGDSDLIKILSLQCKFLRGNNIPSEENDQGFLTVAHSLEQLKKMHHLQPSVISKDGEAVVAYALSMARDCRHLIPVLVPMFESLDHLHYRGRQVNDYRFYIMGQICVDKPYRGTGLFNKLYQKHREQFAKNFDCIITSIYTSNIRSMIAHQRVGFQTIHTHKDQVDEWAIVLWDWK